MEISKDKIIEQLNARNAIMPCSRCGSNSFAVLNQYSKIFIDEKFDGNLKIGTPTVPVALVVCTNCGAVTMHALGALGLLDNKEDADDKK